MFCLQITDNQYPKTPHDIICFGLTILWNEPMVYNTEVDHVKYYLTSSSESINNMLSFTMYMKALHYIM